ncbi:hypothetical protein AXF42_Ash019773 [Apostasia shenzhenica]|uniref:Uncharacterized protein n=1 Tax=Apostasia shenzhenica TaxID=1088818 RepID=A0A2I0AA25_9ASPA|nr:hypothetical protein AXF42_Ash019773 [Apostasia shenzhenica]
MASVMQMLSSYSFMLPKPLMPGFYAGEASFSESKSLILRDELEIKIFEKMRLSNSENVVTISDVEAR